MADRALQILRDLIAIPSVNPMRLDVSEPIERGVAVYLDGILRREGIDCERQEVVKGRENLIAVVDPTVSEEKGVRSGLMFNSHMDTVPVENMTIEPFDPVIKNERVYGRGACDAKGSIAAMVEAVIAYAKSPVRRSKVIFSATVDEEFSFSGALKLIEKQLPIAACVTGEPTNLNSIIAHKGVARWHAKVLGVSAHGAIPHLGRSAICDGARCSGVGGLRQRA
jgi:acetylornithine deacetylase